MDDNEDRPATGSPSLSAPSGDSVGGPALDPSDFRWYGEEDRDIVVGCFAFGTGAGEPMLARIGRQLAEDFALVLRLHPAFVTVPQYIAVERESDGDQTRFESAFAVFYSLPETRLVRQAAKEIGARIAVTGRLVGEGQEVHLGANVLDIERTVLLGVSQHRVPREELIPAFVQAAVSTLRRFSERASDALAAEMTELIGTASYHAYFNWAMACDMERQASLRGQVPDERRLAGRLGYAVRHDPLFFRATRRLAEVAKATHSDAVLEEIARHLEHVPLQHVSTGLLRGQVLLRLERTLEARDWLEDVVDTFPYSAGGFFLLGELEASERPSIAANHYRHAHQIAPNPLYLERLAKLGG